MFSTGKQAWCGRYRDGSWYSPFKADSREPYITEGTTRQYTFYVPQDIPGLVKLMGERKCLNYSSTVFFEKWILARQRARSPNSLFMQLHGFTWKTQLAGTKILKRKYSDRPGGLSGNDMRQMSLVYFCLPSVLPVDPVAANYPTMCAGFWSYWSRCGGKKQLWGCTKILQ